MSDMHATASLHLEVIPAAREQAPILANLVELYAHDFSEFHAVALGDDGRFGYPSLPLYWSESGRHPFLLRIDGGWGGFVLVKQGSDVTGNRSAWDMAEFFVVRGCRRRGAGTQVAHKIWRQFPGTWEVRVMQANVAARHFWETAISTFVDAAIHPVSFEKDGQCWNLFSFESKPEEAGGNHRPVDACKGSENVLTGNREGSHLT